MQLLRGVRVIDVSSYVFRPAAAAVLAHWGADVIKVESPGMPDPMRGGDRTAPSALFHHYNRGKRAIALSLMGEAGQDVLQRLTRDADVFVTNHLPRTRAKPHIDVTSWWARGSLAAETMRVSGAEWPIFLVGHGDGMGRGRTAWALVQAADKIPHDPQAIANGFIQQVDTDRGPTPMISPAVMFDENAGQSTRAPGFGEHTDEVLHEIGFSDAEVAGLRAAGDVS